MRINKFILTFFWLLRWLCLDLIIIIGIRFRNWIGRTNPFSYSFSQYRRGLTLALFINVWALALQFKLDRAQLNLNLSTALIIVNFRLYAPKLLINFYFFSIKNGGIFWLSIYDILLDLLEVWVT